MAFSNAMDSMVTKVAGENGCAELNSSNDPRVDLFFSLVRSLPRERMAEQVTACLAESRISRELMASDLVVMAMQTRNCRGGKGEKDLFVGLFIELYRRFPDTMTALLPLVPTYGSYKDLFALAETANQAEYSAPLREVILDFVAKRLRLDQVELEASVSEKRKPQGLSLAAKWAPRESAKNKAGSALAKALALRLFGGEPGKERAQYRKLCSSLNRALGTVEVKMCGAAWEEIDPSAVPSVCMLKQRKALLNEKHNGPNPTPAQRETGNRFPESADRVACRKRLRTLLLEEGMKKLKGKQLYPHEIAKKCMFGSPSDLELEIFSAQWEAIRASVKEAMEAQAAAVASPGGGEAPKGMVNLGQLVPLVDVSGSMSGIPMEVAIALGILVSEFTAPAFANRMLTFESQPNWVKLEDGASIAEKVRATQSAPWGGSTNFEKALEKILEVCVSAKLHPSQIPDMIVFSDMQFDAAAGYGDRWETQYERIVRRFAESGVQVCGEPWPAPQITFWNLRGDTHGFPASADQPGVKMLSGFSPALLKLVLEGGEEEEEVEVMVDGEKQTKKVKATPLDTLRKCLNDGQYDPVREVLSASEEGVFASYSFTPETATEEGRGAAAVTENGISKGDDGDWDLTEAP